MTNGPLNNTWLSGYIYDARNQLLISGGLNYGYDPVGNRIALTNGATVTRFVINPNSKLPQVLMRITGSVTNYYVYGGGLLYQVTETPTTSTMLTYHFDIRGSTIATTDSGGYVKDQVQYSPYGLVIARAGTNDLPFLYNGRFGVITDPNGLMYMRARYYNPYISRFINADPSGFAGGLNFNAFADGNPISMMDPFGLWTWGQVGSGALHFGEGVVVGAAVTAGVILAAPEIAAGGAAALVWAGVSEVAATTVATATVSGGLYAAGGYGAYIKQFISKYTFIWQHIESWVIGRTSAPSWATLSALRGGRLLCIPSLHDSQFRCALWHWISNHARLAHLG